jgi:hypothetical protein
VRRPVSKRDLLRRIEALEARLTQPTPAPLEGQQAFDLPGHDTADEELLPASSPAPYTNP